MGITTKSSICIVTPGHLSTNPRVVKEATSLAADGHKVHVIHGLYSPVFADLDRDLLKGFKKTAVPFGPFFTDFSRYVSQTLSRRSAAMLTRSQLFLASFAARAISSAAPGLLREALRVRADLYIGHYVAALPAVFQAAARHEGAYAFDAEDYHLGDLDDAPAHRHEKHLINFIEASALPGASYVTAASPGIARAYAEKYHIPEPTVLYNVFPLSQSPEGFTLRGTEPCAPSVYWFSQTLGPNRGLECAVNAIALAKSRPHLHLRGQPSPGFQDCLTKLATALKVADRLHFLPIAPAGEMERLAARYDVGLVAETGCTTNRQIALTNKQFSYMLAGIPSVLSDIPAHREFAKEAAGAVFTYDVENAQSLAATLDSLLLDEEKLTTARRMSYELGQRKFNWDKQGKFLLNTVNRAIGERCFAGSN